MKNDNNVVISDAEFEEYKNKVIKKMLALGAGEGDLRFVNDDLIIRNIKLGRRPDDVAWALLQ